MSVDNLARRKRSQLSTFVASFLLFVCRSPPAAGLLRLSASVASITSDDSTGT